jgi:hypothetical protein
MSDGRVSARASTTPRQPRRAHQVKQATPPKTLLAYGATATRAGALEASAAGLRTVRGELAPATSVEIDLTGGPVGNIGALAGQRRTTPATPTSSADGP